MGLSEPYEVQRGQGPGTWVTATPSINTGWGKDEWIESSPPEKGLEI